ncbi:MAG TPA: lysylphosphatidylglycerol synthase domain-containing protein [Gaiellales bacterium]
MMWRWARPASAAAVLVIVVWRLGGGPFLDGLRAVDAGALAAATLIGAVTTVCCAWRWTVVARALDIHISLPAAVAAYYRSLFLNLTLPGGVVGDIHRGVTHGREAKNMGRALRAVAWERGIGQAVQLALTVLVLLALPSPARSSMPVVVAGVAVAALGILLVRRRRPGHVRRVIAGDLRAGVLARRSLAPMAIASSAVVLGHATTFAIAARTAGASAPASRVLPLALLAMLAMVVPSLGGWGPREGAAAWVFGSAGLGAGLGVSTAVAYGVMVLVASLPGGLLLAGAWLRRGSSRRRPMPAAECRVAVATHQHGARRV